MSILVITLLRKLATIQLLNELEVPWPDAKLLQIPVDVKVPGVSLRFGDTWRLR